MSWEYKVITLPAAGRDRVLAMLGADGWELIGFEFGMAYFKRAKIETISAPTATDIVPRIVQTAKKK